MGSNSSNKVQLVQIEADIAGQRIDNFLMKICKGVPKSRLYKAMRRGEVRVNKKRIKPEYRLQHQDEVRIPPLRQGDKPEVFVSTNRINVLTAAIIFENEDLILLNKPAGIAVHGGSGVDYGVVEVLRIARPHCRALELAHRLDRDTSGCLLLGKKASITKALQEQFRKKSVEKTYLMLVHGQCQFEDKTVELPLERYLLASGERRVRVSKQGKPASTEFHTLQRFAAASYLQAKLLTGRTHQLRVHCKSLNHVILGDTKYGDLEQDQQLNPLAAKRLYLHAASLSFIDPRSEQRMSFCATIDPLFAAELKILNLG